MAKGKNWKKAVVMVSILLGLLLAELGSSVMPVYGKGISTYENKKILFMGDSITQLGTKERGWIRYFNQEIKPSDFVNTAVISARWKDREYTVYNGNPVFNGKDQNQNNVMGNQLEKILRGKDVNHPNYSYVEEYQEFDIIMIACGTNDGCNFETDTVAAVTEQLLNADGTLKAVDDLDRQTLAGSVSYVCQELHRIYPNADIFLCTPIYKAKTNQVLTIQYLDALLTYIGSYLDVNIIHTINCGIDYRYEVVDNEGRDLIDGLHPDVSGAKKIAAYNAEAIKKYYTVQ